MQLLPPDEDGLVDLRHALHALADCGVKRLLVEGGARVITSFLRQQLAREATIEIAPRLMGENGLPAFGAAAGPTFSDLKVERAGANVVVRGHLVY